MSTRTKFKRIALALVAVVGFGVLGNAPASNAAVFAETITIDAATDTTFLNDTATAVLTHLWSSSQSAANTDSTTIKSTCTAPSGGTCPSVFFSQTATSDTFGVQVVGDYPTYISGLWTDTASATSSSVRSTVNVKAVNFGTAGTYNFTFYTLGAGGTALSDKSVSWTVTVGTRDLTTASARKYVSTDNYTHPPTQQLLLTRALQQPRLLSELRTLLYSMQLVNPQQPTLQEAPIEALLLGWKIL
jgi:hypothetical protein